MEILTGAGRFTAPAGTDANHYHEQLRVADLSVGTYSVPAGGVDDQKPHTEDEVYVVMAGRASLIADSGTADVSTGDVIFVPAGETHRFVEVTEDLAVLAVFGPAYRTRS